MEIRDSLTEMITDIKEKDKEFKMSPRDFISFFNCEKRTKGNNSRIDKILLENNLETSPNYKNVYINGEITLKHKEKAKSKAESDSIQRINILISANSAPLSVTKEAKLSEALTLMMMNNYSQLPVMSGQRDVIGFITWETIGYAISNGVTSTEVKDFLNTDFTILKYDTPLLEAIKTVIKKEYILVQKKDRTICGMVTIADISSQFLFITEPFLLLEQIENMIRLLLDNNFLLEELRDICSPTDTNSEINYIEDLTFGQYVRLIEKPDNFEKLNLKIDKTYFIKQLHNVREIRNDIMHFNPEGITDEQRKSLYNMAHFLTDISKCKNPA